MRACSIQLPGLTGKVFFGCIDSSTSSKNHFHQITKRFIETHGISQICPLLSFQETHPTLDGIQLLETYQRFRHVKIEHFPISDIQDIDIGRLRTFVDGIIEYLKAGKNVLIHGKDEITDRAAMIAACIARRVLESRHPKEAVALVQRNCQDWDCPPREMRVIEDLAPIGASFKISEQMFSLLRHVQLTADTTQEYRKLGIRHILLTGDDYSSRMAYAWQGFSAQSFPFTRGGALPPAELKKMTGRVQQLLREGERPLLLDVNEQRRTMYALACVARTLMKCDAERAIQVIQTNFPGTELTTVQERSIRQLFGEPPPRPSFEATLHQIDGFSLHPGKGSVFRAQLPYELGRDPNAIKQKLKEKAITHLILICTDREAEEVDDYQKNLAQIFSVIGIGLTRCSLGDRTSFKKAVNQLIKNSLFGTHTAVCCPSGLQHSGMLLTAAIAQSECIPLDEASGQLGYDPHLTNAQRQFLEILTSG